MLNIPKHTNCKGCAQCCGINPLSIKESINIMNFLKENEKELEKVKSVISKKKSEVFMCAFLNEEDRRCSIYKVRPIVCRIFGVAKGLVCVNGNSDNIDFALIAKDEFSDFRSIAITNRLVEDIKEL